MTYDFAAQLALGQVYEHELDGWFSEFYIIEPATREQQRQGIDRIFHPHTAPNESLLVEYKADCTAARTGNAFVETVSVDTTNKPGWAYASKADLLIYLIPGNCPVLYIIKMADLRERLPHWLTTCASRHIPNQGYHTVGLLVPLTEFEMIGKKVVDPASELREYL